MNVLELWDLRKYKKFRDINWDGPKKASDQPLAAGGASGSLESQMEEEKLVDGDKPDDDKDVKDTEEKKEETAEAMSFSRQSPAPFIYSA